MKVPRRFIVIGSALAGLALLSGALVPAGRALEQQPAFCASCHVMDTTYQNWRDTGAARYHPTCIECHSGSGLGGTVRAELQGIHELAAHISGWYQTPLHARVPNAYCTKCHNNASRLQGIHAEIRQFSLRNCAGCHNHKMGHAFNPERRGRREPFEGVIIELERKLDLYSKLDFNGDGKPDYFIRLRPSAALRDAQNKPVKAEQLRAGDQLLMNQRGNSNPIKVTVVEVQRFLDTTVKLDVNEDHRADYIVLLGLNTVLQDAQDTPYKPQQLRVGDHLAVRKFWVGDNSYEAQQAVVSGQQ